MKVAIYCRVSTLEQNINTQVEGSRKYCQAQGWDIVREYIDSGESGSKESRPEFDLMLQDMRSNKFNCIVVYKLDRIGRSLKHIISMFEEFSNRGIHFVATTQNIDTSTSSGKLQLQIMGAFAEFERNLISERTKEALKNNPRVGKRGPDKRTRKKRKPSFKWWDKNGGAKPL